MNRATAIMAGWDATITADTNPRDRRLAVLEDTVSEAQRSVAKLRQSNTELEQKNQAAVTVIVELHAQLRAAQGAEPTGTVTPITRRNGSPRSARCY